MTPAASRSGSAVSVTINAGRRTVEISRPDKLLFPCGITKSDLANYYAEVAEVMLPHLSKRPVNLERYPDGIEGHRIIQQHAGKHFPDWIARVKVGKQGGEVEHVMVNDAASLVYLANQAAITFHCWPSRSDRLTRPDRMIFDLDPSREDPDEVRRAAAAIVGLLDELSLEPFVMTSGSRGYHVLVALQRRAEFAEVREFSRRVAALAARRQPDLFTTEQRKAKRGDRILIDVMRNGYAHTSVAPYSVRPRPGAPVATPLYVAELSDRATRPDRWDLKSVLSRLARDGDPWADLRSRAQTLTAARKRLEAALEH